MLLQSNDCDRCRTSRSFVGPFLPRIRRTSLRRKDCRCSIRQDQQPRGKYNFHQPCRSGYHLWRCRLGSRRCRNQSDFHHKCPMYNMFLWSGDYNSWCTGVAIYQRRLQTKYIDLVWSSQYEEWSEIYSFHSICRDAFQNFANRSTTVGSEDWMIWFCWRIHALVWIEKRGGRIECSIEGYPGVLIDSLRMLPIATTNQKLILPFQHSVRLMTKFLQSL